MRVIHIAIALFVLAEILDLITAWDRRRKASGV